MFDTEITIQGETYNAEVYVVPDYAMSHSMLLGKELTRSMDVNIRGGQITIKKLLTNKSKKEEPEKEDRKKEDNSEGDGEALCDLPFVNYVKVEVNSGDMIDRYRDELEKLIKDHTPRKEVQTNVETKIILQDEIPICLRPRRLAVKEKAILNEQIERTDRGYATGLSNRAKANIQAQL